MLGTEWRQNSGLVLGVIVIIYATILIVSQTGELHRQFDFASRLQAVHGIADADHTLTAHKSVS